MLVWMAPFLQRWHLLDMAKQFVTDENGKKVAVVLPVQEFEGLMEVISDLVAVAERCGEGRISLDEVKQRLIADGLLSNLVTTESFTKSRRTFSSS